MFGKPSRENPKPPATASIPDLKLPENLAIDPSTQAKSLATKAPVPTTSPRVAPDSELVTTVEKISRIASPYFIAIVGLSLYEENFFLGTILISVGILSLLKVSAKDVAVFLEWLKDFLGFGEEPEL